MKPLPILRRSKMVEEVFEVLKEKILSGEIKQGERLPTQEELTEQFGVSRTVIREAINKLSSLGLVSCEQGRGTFVTMPDSHNMFESMLRLYVLDDKSTIELIEARLYFESAIARLAAMRRKPSDIVDLYNILNKLEYYAKDNDLENWAKSDLEFHMKLGEIAGNRLMKTFVDAIRDITFDYLLKLSKIPSEVNTSIKRHKEIIEAIDVGDPDLAEEKMIEHFGSVKDVVHKYLNYELNI